MDIAFYCRGQIFVDECSAKELSDHSTLFS